MSIATPTWKPREETLQQVESLMKSYRPRVDENLRALVHYPAMITSGDVEYRKMVELSSKMSIVGLACTEIAGHPFDERRLRIASLFGSCCFLGDSFLDDFGEDIANEYLDRYELLLTKGWFEIRNDREQLFYVVLARLFGERDVLDTMLRQAIFGLYLSQRRDVEMRRGSAELRALPRRTRLGLLKRCARDRSGHAITMLSLFLVPQLPLQYQGAIFAAGSLIMFIDDHGDCHYDRHYRRLTFMNQVKNPAKSLGQIFRESIRRIQDGLPDSTGRELLVGFLYRYYVTRLEKHRLERGRGASSWTVYE